MLDNLIAFCIKLAIAGLEISIGLLLGPKVKQFIEKFSDKAVDKGILTFMGSLANISIKVLAVIIALSQLGVDITVVVGLFSALGLGISLSLQNNMANLASGLQILLTRPFTIGDFVSCEGKEGVVAKIELMFTTLLTFDRQEIVIPNSFLVNNPLTNFSQEPYRRTVIGIQVPSTCNPQAFKDALMKMLEEHPLVAKDPAFNVLTTAINPGSYTVSVYAYTQVANYWPLTCDLNQKIIEMKLAMGIEQPYESVQIKNSGLKTEAKDMPAA